VPTLRPTRPVLHPRNRANEIQVSALSPRSRAKGSPISGPSTRNRTTGTTLGCTPPKGFPKDPGLSKFLLGTQKSQSRWLPKFPAPSSFLEKSMLCNSLPICLFFTTHSSVFIGSSGQACSLLLLLASVPPVIQTMWREAGTPTELHGVYGLMLLAGCALGFGLLTQTERIVSVVMRTTGLSSCSPRSHKNVAAQPVARSLLVLQTSLQRGDARMLPHDNGEKDASNNGPR